MPLRNYFKRLQALSDIIKDGMKSERVGTKEYDRWFECQKVLLVVIKYSLNRGNKPSAREKIQAYWENGCDFMLAIEHLDNISYDVIRNSVARESRNLYNELGTNILDALSEGRPVDAHIEFVVRTHSLILSDVIPSDIVYLLPEPAFDINYKLDDCINELKILRAISYMSIKELLMKADQAKLRHLLAVMKGDGDYSSTEVQKKLWRFLMGADELKAMLNELKTKNLID